MATTFSGSTVADPITPISKNQVLQGEQRRMHDGTLHTVFTAIKWRWTLEWDLLTEAERDAVYLAVQTTGSQSFSPPETASTFTVVVLQDTYRETPQAIAEGASVVYGIEFDVEEYQ